MDDHHLGGRFDLTPLGNCRVILDRLIFDRAILIKLHPHDHFDVGSMQIPNGLVTNYCTKMAPIHHHVGAY